MASTLVQFLHAPSIRRRYYSQYSQGSVASFGTQFNTDWGAYVTGGAAIVVAAKAGASTVAEVVIAPNLVLEVNPTDWVGYNPTDGWQVVPNASMGRSVTDGATNTNTTVTSSTAAFASPGDVGAIISGPGIPGGTTIVTVGSSTSVTISAAATATATGKTLTIIPVSALYAPAVI